ncbi:hypothetical protein GGR52DRAFT_544024 [Hypoxylon sp. FL1284]|nr:hypothetical protein GGR52DRAFT_544024 [Hypoxylon sp. FL1284]
MMWIYSALLRATVTFFYSSATCTYRCPHLPHTKYAPSARTAGWSRHHRRICMHVYLLYPRKHSQLVTALEVGASSVPLLFPLGQARSNGSRPTKTAMSLHLSAVGCIVNVHFRQQVAKRFPVPRTTASFRLAFLFVLFSVCPLVASSCRSLAVKRGCRSSDG